MSVKFSVEANVRVTGGAAAATGLGATAKAADNLQSSLARVGTGGKMALQGVTDMAGGVVSSVVGTVARATAIGAAGVVAAGVIGTKAIVSNLSMLEDKSIQMASVMAAATGTPFEKMRGESDKLFKQFRADAVKSAGETADFVNVASLIAGPILGAGKSMDDLHTLTKGVMNVAPALGASFQQAGSDVMRMLQGGAGAELPFFKAMQAIPSLGVKSAEAWNKLPFEKKFSILEKISKNEAFMSGASAMGETLTGLASTAADVAKTIGGGALQPFFDRGKKALSNLMSTMIAGLGDGGPIQAVVGAIGMHMDHGLYAIGQNLMRIFGTDLAGSVGNVMSLVERMSHGAIGGLVSASGWIADHWSQITATASSFASKISSAAQSVVKMVSALGGGDFVQGLERMAILYGGAKLAGAVGPGALKMAGGMDGLKGMGSSVAGVMKPGALGSIGSGALGAMGIGGGASLSTATGGAMGAAAGAGDMGLLGSLGTVGSSSLASFGAMIPPVAVALVMLAGVMAALKTPVLGLVDMGGILGGAWSSLKTSMGGVVESVSGAATGLWSTIAPVVGLFGTGIMAHLSLIMYGLSMVGNVVSGVINGLSAAASFLGTQADRAANLIRSVLIPALDSIAEAVGPTISAAVDAVSSAFDACAAAAGAAAGAVSGFVASVMSIVSQLGKSDKDIMQDALSNDDYTSPRVDMGATAMAPVMGSSAIGSVKPSKPVAKGGGGGGKNEITIKWDLGDPNPDALWVRSRDHLMRELQSARGTLAGPRLPFSMR